MRPYIAAVLLALLVTWSLFAFSFGTGLGGGGTADNPLYVRAADVRSYKAGTAALTFSSIGAKSCSAQTITVTGAVVGQEVVLGAPTGVLSIPVTAEALVSAADTVSVRLCNMTSSGTSLASATWNVDVRQPMPVLGMFPLPSPR